MPAVEPVLSHNLPMHRYELASPMTKCSPSQFSLFTLRSKLAQDIMGYYEAVLKHFEYAEWGVKVSDTRVAARVFKQVLWRSNSDSDVYPADFPRGGMAEPAAMGARVGERPEIVFWEREMDHIREKGAVIRGGPGSGKSFLTSTTILDTASAALDRLRKQQVHLENSLLPIHVVLETLTKTKPISFSRAVLNYVQDELDSTFSIALKDWFLQRILSNDALWLLDGIDQVGVREHKTLAKWLTTLTAYNCRIVVTCRTTAFNPTLLSAEQYTVFDMVPFGLREIRQFVENWYGRTSDKGTWLLDVFERNISLQAVCGSPLILKLACLVNQDRNLPVDTARVDLYKAIVVNLLRESGLKQEVLESWLDRTAALAWDVFKGRPESNLFVRDEVVTTARTQKERQVADRLLQRLLRSRIVEMAGPGQYRFAHRTILEFLAARHMVAATLTRDAGWENAKVDFPNVRGQVALALLIDRQSWLPAWSQAIVLLAGCLGSKATPMIDLLWSGRSDIAWHRRSLALQCLAELRESERNEQQADDLTAEAYRFLQAHHKRNTEPLAERGCWTAIPAVNGRINRERLIDLLIREVNAGVETAYLSLGWMGAPAGRDPRVIEALVSKVASSIPRSSTRYDAAIALSEMPEQVAKAEGAIPKLLQVVLSPGTHVNDPIMEIFKAAGESVGYWAAKLCGVIPHLLSLAAASHTSEGVRWNALYVLKAMGEWAARENSVIPGLLSLMIADDTDESFRGAVAEVLGAIGRSSLQSRDLIRDLHRLATSQEGDDSSRFWVISALGGLGDLSARVDGVIPTLRTLISADATSDRDRQASINALSLLGERAANTEGVVPAVLSWAVSGSAPRWVRRAALQAIGTLGRWVVQGRDEIVVALLRLASSSHTDEEWRGEAAWALSQIGEWGVHTNRVVSAMLTIAASEDMDDLTRIYAIQAIGAMRRRPVNAGGVIPALLRLAGTPETSDWLRADAVKALGSLCKWSNGGEDAGIVNFLLRILVTEETPKQICYPAAEAMQKMFQAGYRVFEDHLEVSTVNELASLTEL
jgi:hypothetical protein